MKELRITVFHVGDGDAIAIEFPNGKVGLVDSNITPWRKVSPVVEFAHKLNREIQFVCLTHPHADHFSGLFKLFENERIRVREFWSSLSELDSTIDYLNLFRVPPPTLGLEQYAGAIKTYDVAEFPVLMKEVKRREENNRIEIHELRDGKDLGKIGGVEVRCIAPPYREVSRYNKRIQRLRASNIKSDRQFENPMSAVLCLRYGKTLTVLSGDCPAKILKRRLLKDPAMGGKREISTFIIKVAHHGASDGWSPELVDKWSASNRIAIISGGSDLHPAPVTLKTLKNERIQTHITGHGVLGEARLGLLRYSMRKEGPKVPVSKKAQSGDITVVIKQTGEVEIRRPARLPDGLPETIRMKPGSSAEA